MSRVAECISSSLSPAPESSSVPSEGEQQIDGVIRLSQGGAMAALLAAALESSRTVPESGDWAWVEELRQTNRGRPLKSAVSYSGFCAPPDELKWLYEGKIPTPTLHDIRGL